MTKYMADQPVNLFIGATFKLTKTLLVALVFCGWSYVPMDSNVWRHVWSSKRCEGNCVRMYIFFTANTSVLSSNQINIDMSTSIKKKIIKNHWWQLTAGVSKLFQTLPVQVLLDFTTTSTAIAYVSPKKNYKIKSYSKDLIYTKRQMFVVEC